MRYYWPSASQTTPYGSRTASGPWSLWPRPVSVPNLSCCWTIATRLALSPVLQLHDGRRPSQRDVSNDSRSGNSVNALDASPPPFPRTPYQEVGRLPPCPPAGVQIWPLCVVFRLGPACYEELTAGRSTQDRLVIGRAPEPAKGVGERHVGLAKRVGVGQVEPVTAILLRSRRTWSPPACTELSSEIRRPRRARSVDMWFFPCARKTTLTT